MERVLLVDVRAPRGHAVVEAVQGLRAVVDRSEGLHLDLLAVRRLADSRSDVVERDVDARRRLPMCRSGPRAVPRVRCQSAMATDLRESALEHDDRAQHFAALHLVERVLDVVETDRLRHELVERESALQVEVDERREIARRQGSRRTKSA